MSLLSDFSGRIIVDPEKSGGGTPYSETTKYKLLLVANTSVRCF